MFHPACAPVLHRALGILLEGFNAAAEHHANPWDFAVDIAELRDARVTAKALRVLVQKGYVQHAVETTKRSGKQRRSRKDDTLPFTDKSCFVLTDTGVVAARELSRDVPFYDGDERELCGAGSLSSVCGSEPRIKKRSCCRSKNWDGLGALTTRSSSIPDKTPRTGWATPSSD